MNDELMNHREALIKRIDEQMKAIKPYDKNGYRSEDFDIHALLYDCRAEIERLTEELKESRALGLKLAQDRETNELKADQMLKQISKLKKQSKRFKKYKYLWGLS